MAVTWKVLGQSVLTGTGTAIYTPAAATYGAVHTAQLWNPTAAPVVCDVFIGASAVDGTHVDRVTVPATSVATSFGLINSKLQPGQSVYALGLGVTLTLTGAESV